jgi:hypothetical protein
VKRHIFPQTVNSTISIYINVLVQSAHHNHNESFECFYQQYHKYRQIGLSAILLIMSVSTFKTVVILYICNFLNTSFAVMIYSPIIIFYKDYNFLCDLHLNHVYVQLFFLPSLL